MRDFIALFDELDAGRACWTYTALDFGLSHKDGRMVNRELVELASRRRM